MMGVLVGEMRYSKALMNHADRFGLLHYAGLRTIPEGCVTCFT